MNAAVWLAENQRLIHSLIYSKVFKAQEHDDAVQDVNLAILAGAHTYDETRGPFSAWAVRVAFNRAADSSIQKGVWSAENLPDIIEETGYTDPFPRKVALQEPRLTDQERVFVEGIASGLSLSEAHKAAGYTANHPNKTLKAIRLRVGREIGLRKFKVEAKVKGESRQKISDERVEAVRNAEGTVRELAARYGVSRSMVQAIKAGTRR